MLLMENELLPYVTSPLPSGPWMVFAPHPDDETFGMGGSLLLAQQQGIETHVVFTTDGAMGGNGNQEELIQERMQEAVDATNALGVTEIHFLAEPDRGLQVSERLINTISEIIEKTAPASVFFPSPLEFHPDHRSTTELVWKCVQRMSSANIDAYSYEISALAPINLLIDVTEVAEEKYEVVKMYSSQLTQAKYLALVQSLDTARTFSLPLDRTAAEGYFKYANKNESIEQQLMRSIHSHFKGLYS